MRSVIPKERHKDEVNAELLNILDRDYNLMKAYPQTNHPTKIEFWASRNPELKPDFEVLMHRYRKTSKVTLQGFNDYFVEIDDDR